MRYVFVNYVIIANQEQDATSYLRKKILDLEFTNMTVKLSMP
jgi:hypothetical protein